MGSSNDYIHIVMVPFMAHGHLIPFLALAKQIHHQIGFNIAIANTPLNIQYLRSTLRGNPIPGIHFLELQFNSSDHGLPPNTENTENLSLDLIDNAEFNVPGFPDRCKFHVSQLHDFLRKADGTDLWSKFMQPQILSSLKSFGWLCNTVEEIEPYGLDLLRKYIKSPVWSIGPLLPKSWLINSSASGRQHAGKEPGTSPEKCVQWLDMHSDDSVLYISFGSQNTISPSNMMELATGLEKAGKPFAWVIRPPLGFDLKAEFKPEWLPEGFEDRMSRNNQGLLVKNWAPQLEILSHRSTGAFLSHCGWNSTMESLSQGVKIIGWPLVAEQAYNSKMLVEEMGVAVELTRGVRSSISSDKVKEVIEMVMGKEGKGRDMKRKAQEIAEHIMAAVKDEGNEKGSSIKALDDFVSTITTARK
ncbi:hypothetical protein ES319_D02G016700v1 [Gossypium barbadense]|uniref:Glycosyltransferase n=2 Tax=Gossypium TaxID=3633 RepID=A0A5J5SC30_GOSBA|nr:hypothetical protein ES319_D02G016700v1 [Gossypium barbadense]TYH81905.1 hypothetical protein ES332_D02G018300v1 [Gossypium tomentosum]